MLFAFFLIICLSCQKNSCVIVIAPPPRYFSERVGIDIIISNDYIRVFGINLLQRFVTYNCQFNSKNMKLTRHGCKMMGCSAFIMT